MSETATETPASLGGVERFSYDQMNQMSAQSNAGEGQPDNGNGEPGGNNGEGGKDIKLEGNTNNGNNVNNANNSEAVVDDISEDKIKAYLEKNGITGFQSIDELKNKLNSAGAVQPTPEELAKAEAELDKRMLDLFLEGGGNIDNYAIIKQVANMDLAEFSEKELVRELKGKGFNDAEIAAIKKERYYQINPEEIERDLVNGESEEEFEARKEALKKKQEVFGDKLKNRSKYAQDQAKNILNNLKNSIVNSDASKKAHEEKERKLSAKTDEILKNIPRTKTYQLGEGADGTKIADIEDKIDESVFEKVSGILKDETQRNNFLFTPENELNLQAIAEMMIENESLKKALKNVYLEASTRSVNHFRSVFPFNSATALGVGTNGKDGTSIASKAQPVKLGKAERVPVGKI